MSRRPHIAPDELAAYGDALLALRRLRADFVARIEAEERALVGVMRQKGATWEEVGEVFGISRPAARKRFLSGAPHDEGAE